jgi:hypothetical protein
MKLEWSPETEFSVPGFVLETLVHELNDKLSNEGAQKIIRIYESHKALQSIINNGIAEGKVRRLEE